MFSGWAFAGGLLGWARTLVKGEERWPTYVSQRQQDVDAMLAQVDCDERAKVPTLPSWRRTVWAAAAGVGALALTIAVMYFQLATSAPAVGEHDFVSGILSDGTIVHVEMPQTNIPRPGKESDDAERPPAAEHDQPEIALGSEASQSPPVEQPKQEASVALPQELQAPQQIKGAADASLVDGWPIIDGKTVHLSGVETIVPDKADQVDHWIKAHGRYLECNRSGADTYRCLTTRKLDLAQVLLLNGVARATVDAEPLYHQAEEQAQVARRGLWH